MYNFSEINITDFSQLETLILEDVFQDLELEHENIKDIQIWIERESNVRINITKKHKKYLD